MSNEIIICIVFIAVYFFCAIYNYRWVVKSYNDKYGILHGDEPEWKWLFLIVTPVVNYATFLAFVSRSPLWYKEEKTAKENNFLYKFFKIKRNE